jgi:hypothetical protein
MQERMARADLDVGAAHQRAEGGIAPADVRPPGATWRRRPLPRVVLRLLLGAWIAAGTIGGATLVVGHSFALPRSAAASPTVTPPRADGRPPIAGTAPWSTLHVLYAGCRCSEAIFAHLFQRGTIAGTTERIVLVATGSEEATAAAYLARATAAGFAVETVKPDDLVRHFGVEAAPLLVVADPSGRIRYAGGYTDRKQHLELGDETIIAELMGGRASTELPLLASAVSRRLQDALDLPRNPGRRTGE